MQVNATDSGVKEGMPTPVSRLFCRLDGLTPAVREQQRFNLLKSLGLLETETILVFDEATQTASRFIETPICHLGLMVHEHLWLKSAIGLSRLGLMNELASSRRIERQEAFCSYVVDSQQTIIIEDTFKDLVFARSLLVQHYGIRAYLGTPLVTSDGWCLGTLAVMDLVPRQFSLRDVEFLTLIARWCLREFERDYLSKNQAAQANEWVPMTAKPDNYPIVNQDINDSLAETKSAVYSISDIKLRLLRGLTQELRTPLTSVIGMASILCSEVFGPLSNKQKEYIKIIHNSGQQMNSLVAEILKLGTAEENTTKLDLIPVNLEMLCQHLLNDLSSVARQKRQELRLSVEPGKRIWLLDKEKVTQALYYLIMSVLESSDAGGEVRIHVSRRNNTLNIAIWISHPWLGDGLPQVTFHESTFTNSLSVEKDILPIASKETEPQLGNQILSVVSLEATLNRLKNFNQNQTSEPSNPQALLGLLLACYLAEHHGGKIMVQGSSESGYRYVLMLPKISAE